MAKTKSKKKPERDEKIQEEQVNFEELELDEFLMKLTSTESVEEAREATQGVFQGAVKNARLLNSTGVVAIAVTPNGALSYSMSPYLEFSLDGLDLVERAFRDIQEVIRTRRRDLMQRQMEKNAEGPETIEGTEENDKEK